MDPMISLGQKNTLAKYMILSGADNRPPMLDKDLYDSWKSRMELYMQTREHGRMILESVEHGPLICPTVEENGVIRTKKYDELSAAKKIQADCDMKATNIILQGLSADIDSLLINDMNIYKMKMEQFQVNTKFLNSLPLEWSFAVLVFSPGDDPFIVLYKESLSNCCSFSRFLTTNNQLQTLPPIQKPSHIFKMAGLQCNNFRGDKGKITLVLLIRTMLQVQGEILQLGRQELLNATTAKKLREAGKQIWDKDQLAFCRSRIPQVSSSDKSIPHNVAFQIDDPILTDLL
ncbi:hypothetical protein Tco_0486601 [Tanacetum coccineum]